MPDSKDSVEENQKNVQDHTAHFSYWLQRERVIVCLCWGE